MDAQFSTNDRIRIGAQAILWFALAICFAISAPLLTSWSWWLLVGFILAGFILAVPLTFLRKTWAKKSPGYSTRSLYLRTATGLSILLLFLAALPVYYFSYDLNANPKSVPKVALTNGDKTVVFQGMIHVGSEGFYKSIAYDVERAIADGYHVHYEGIKGSPEGDEFLSKYMGNGNQINDNYKLVSNIAGFQFQKDYFTIMEKHAKENPDRVKETDVSSLDLKVEYERLLKTDPEFAAAEGPQALAKQSKGGGADNLISMLDMLNESTPAQRQIIGIISRGFINQSISATKPETQREKLILHYRNRYLMENVLADKHDKIYILYGAAHIPGSVELMRQQDPNWKVKSVTWQRALAAPEVVKGQQLPGVVVD